MSQLVVERSVQLTGSDGTAYDRVWIRARFQPSGVWEAWIEIVPVGARRGLRTDNETTQPDLAAVAYWAGGLEPLYFEGALARAEKRRRPRRRLSGAGARGRRRGGSAAAPSSRRSRSA